MKPPPKWLRDMSGSKGHMVVSGPEVLGPMSSGESGYPLTQRFCEKLRSEIGWLESIVTHNGEVGSFYERVFMNNLKRIVPRDVFLGSGFTYDIARGLTSNQIDVLAYSGTSPYLFRDDSLVILEPKFVNSAIEIKKTLTLAEVEKLTKYVTNKLGDPFGTLNVVALTKKCTAEKVFERYVQKLREKFAEINFEVPDGGKGFWSVPHFTGLNFYFLDDRKFITTRIHPGNQKQILSIEMFRDPVNTCGLGDLINTIIFPIKGGEAHSPDYYSHALRDQVASEELEFQCSVSWGIPDLIDYAHHLKDELAILSKAQEVYALTIPTDINLKSARSLHDLLEDGRVAKQFVKLPAEK